MEELKGKIKKLYKLKKECSNNKKINSILYDIVTCFTYIDKIDAYDIFDDEIIAIYYECLTEVNEIRKIYNKYINNYLKKNMDDIKKLCINNFLLLDNYILDNLNKESNCIEYDEKKFIDMLENEDYIKYVLKNLDKIKFKSISDDKSICGATMHLSSTKESVFFCDKNIYTVTHELIHGFCYNHISNNNTIPVYYHLHDEIFSYSSELIIASKINDLENKKIELCINILQNIENIIDIIYNNKTDDESFSDLVFNYKYCVGMLGAFRQYMIYKENKEEYNNNLKYFYNNYYTFLKTERLNKIGISKEDMVSGDLLKKVIKL